MDVQPKTSKTLVERLTEQLKRGVLSKKLDEANLDAIITLAEALKVFLK